MKNILLNVSIGLLCVAGFAIMVYMGQISFNYPNLTDIQFIIYIKDSLIGFVILYIGVLILAIKNKRKDQS